jgi:Subtilisin inhibitor-like
MRFSLRRARSRAPHVPVALGPVVLGPVVLGPVVLATVTLATVALAGCGAVTSTARSGGPATAARATAARATPVPAAPVPASSAPAAAPSQAGAKISVIVEVTSRPGAKVERWTLQCEPTGGTLPDPAAACHELLTATRPFAPMPRGIMCPMVVTGEQTATIRGSWLGVPVDATFSQLSDCGAMRWRELGQVFNPLR